MTAELERRALRAAGAVADAQRIPCDDPVLVASGSNVLVHLRPSPVVARVMTGTVALHADPRGWLARELAVLRFLAPSGLAVAPCADAAPGPHEQDGLWMTLVGWVPDTGPAVRPTGGRQVGRALRDLHDALEPFPGDLDTADDLRGRIERLLHVLEPADVGGATALTALGSRLDELRGDVFASTLPARALHGDVSLSNLLRTPTGLVWNDFEDTFRGPAHWDVAGLVLSLRGRGAGPEVVRDALDGYGWEDDAALAPFFAAHDVYDEVWRAYDRRRRR
ncbi:aminoglycoside phosphotransferase family protein [Patulibacter minatonensis]|uniref:phosphotransferase n=1 Tax=Patulibacter minatonensis TaxID=298163 RepID=UPI0006883769|nr:aminoglycoside phosphotransferase family protein [Patulibacter minatonensis]